MSKLTNDLCSRCQGKRFLIEGGAAKICPKCDGKGHYTQDRAVTFAHIVLLLMVAVAIFAAVSP